MTLYDAWMAVGTVIFDMTQDELEDYVNEKSTERYCMGVEVEMMNKESAEALVDEVFDKLFERLDELKKEAVAKLNEPVSGK